MTDLATLLDLSPAGEDRFRSLSPGGASMRVFGGQVIGQALMAGLRTVDPARPGHSFHAHFLHAGDSAAAIDFVVDRVRDGRSLSTRAITARQGDRALLTATLSCHVSEPGIVHQDQMPDVPGPDGLRTEAEIREEAWRREDVAWTGAVRMTHAAAELRPVTPRDFVSPRPMGQEQHFWVRLTGPVPGDRAMRQASLAYLSDMMLLSTTLLPHGIYWTTTAMDSASLDHAIWFHALPAFDDWLLWTIRTPWAGGARGLATGRFFDRHGRLVASVTQEGLIRVRDERQS